MLRLCLLCLFVVTSLTSLQLEALPTDIEKTYRFIDDLAIQAGTDKSSLANNHTKVYAKIFNDLKDEPIKFLEIGIYKGNSVKMWEGFFPKADLYFADITDSHLEYRSTRSRYDYLDQSNITNLLAYLAQVGGNFDIIIDDGGHEMHQQMTSFHVLFPYIKSGGIYVIEDLCTSYWKWYGGIGDPEHPQSGPNSTTEMLKRLTDDIHYYTARTACADYDKLPPSLVNSLGTYQKSVESIHFYPNMCVIIKR